MKTWVTRKGSGCVVARTRRAPPLSRYFSYVDLDRDFTIALKRKYATLAKDVKIPVGRQLSIEFSYQSMGRAKTPSGATPLARN